MSAPEIKHPKSGAMLPDEVWADPGRHGWYFRKRMPDSVAKFARTDTSQFALGFRAGIEAAAAKAKRVWADTSYWNDTHSLGKQKQESALDALPETILSIPTPGDPLPAALGLKEVRALVEAAEYLMRAYDEANNDRLYPLDEMHLMVDCNSAIRSIPEARAAIAAIKDPIR
jgi:hypothetical protein